MKIYIHLIITIFCAFVCLNTHFLLAGVNNKPKIKGHIFNAETQQPLAATNISLLGTELGTSSDSKGFFQLSVSQDSCSLRISHIGFADEIIQIKKSTCFDEPLLIYLLPANLMLHSVEIHGNRFEKSDRSIENLNIKKIEARDIVNLPGAMDDPIRAAQIYSGVGGGGDFNSFLTTRGSSPAQNQVIMDGIAIPNPYRMRIAMGGGLSIFNPQTIDDVHLHLGGYSAEYGNALSSVLAVTTREGSRDKSRYSLSLNLTDLNGVAEGALQNGKGSYLVSLRRTYFDLLASGFASEGSVLPFSQEISGKLTYDFNPAHQLQFSILNNNEQMKLLAGAENPADFNSTEEAKLAYANAAFRSVLMNRFILKSQIATYKDRTNFHTYRNVNEEDNEFAVQDVFSENYRLNLKQTAYWQID
ncbi:MAG: hypothetical protein DWQ10_11205 [Calditrichaeota bacterium]|nr:MAG: hypothetical protein DWQ10_11205 [Calditrichota bacterium]